MKTAAIIYYTFISLVLNGCDSSEDHQAAFIQTGDELQFFNVHEGGMFAVQSDIAALARAAAMATEMRAAVHDETLADELDVASLLFEPPRLQFGSHVIGIPHLRKVTVTNTGQAQIRFDAISGSTTHFHCSFFDKKVLEAGQSTTFDVVFLPRSEGNIKTTLHIHFSTGQSKFTVSGSGMPSPYRIRPVVSARVPVNGSFVTNVDIHNPHSTTLKVTEMYTSGGDLHLELPIDKEGDSAHRWEIPPYRTRTVMRARYIASKEINTTAYISIRTNHVKEPLIVPFEVEVSSESGMYASVDRLDFGILRPHEESRTLHLNVLNASNRSLHITKVFSEPQNEAVKIALETSNIKPSARNSARVANLVFQASKATNELQYSGRIIVKSEAGDEEYKLSVPYSASVLKGNLLHDNKELAFYGGLEYPLSEPIRKPLVVTSTFAQPLIIYAVHMSKNLKKYFKIIPNDDPTIVLEPHTASRVAMIEYYGCDVSDLTLEGLLKLSTNASLFDLPLFIYSGKLRLTMYSVEQDMFDFGVMDAGDRRSILFALTNENPIPITVEKLTNAIEVQTELQLLGIERGNQSVLARDHEPSEYSWHAKDDLVIPAHSFAVFRYNVQAPNDKAIYHSAMTLRTEHEVRQIPVTFLVEDGSIFSVPNKIFFEDAFPGKLSSQPVQLYSTFTREMVVLRLSTLSFDPRFFFEPFERNQAPIVRKNKLTYLGRVFFFPYAGCVDDCYLGLPLHSEIGMEWTRGLELPEDLAASDGRLFRFLRNRWLQMVAQGHHLVNATIVVDTTEVKSFDISAQGKLSWPRLMKQTQVHFPLTAPRNITVVNLTLHNPSSMPVVVQLIPLPLYPNPDSFIAEFANDLGLASLLTYKVEAEDFGMFTLRDCELFNNQSESPVPYFRQTLEQQLDKMIPKYTLTMTLQPGMKVRVRLGFRPKDYSMHSSLLIIRNNLTVLETIPLHGRGGRAELRLGRFVPYSQQPLMFELHDRQPKICEPYSSNTSIYFKGKKLPYAGLINRSFVARNSGEIPIYVQSIWVHGYACQSRGFRVINCEPFFLKPNDSHVLDIIFLPDFTQTYYEAALQLHVGNFTPFVYQMAASIPADYIARCHQMALRLPWEPVAYYVSILALIFLLIFVVAASYLEGDNIITRVWRAQKYQQLQAEKMAQEGRGIFDLRHINDDERSWNGQISHNSAMNAKREDLQSVVSYSSPRAFLRVSMWILKKCVQFCKGGIGQSGSGNSSNAFVAQTKRTRSSSNAGTSVNANSLYNNNIDSERSVSLVHSHFADGSCGNNMLFEMTVNKISGGGSEDNHVLNNHPKIVVSGRTDNEDCNSKRDKLQQSHSLCASVNINSPSPPLIQKHLKRNNRLSSSGGKSQQQNSSNNSCAIKQTTSDFEHSTKSADDADYQLNVDQQQFDAEPFEIVQPRSAVHSKQLKDNYSRKNAPLSDGEPKENRSSRTRVHTHQKNIRRSATESSASNGYHSALQQDMLSVNLQKPPPSMVKEAPPNAISFPCQTNGVNRDNLERRRSQGYQTEPEVQYADKVKGVLQNGAPNKTRSQASSPFMVAARLTADVVGKAKRSAGSESDYETNPEWDTQSVVSHTLDSNIDDSYDQIFAQTAVVSGSGRRNLDSSSRSSSCSSRDASGSSSPSSLEKSIATSQNGLRRRKLQQPPSQSLLTNFNSSPRLRRNVHSYSETATGVNNVKNNVVSASAWNTSTSKPLPFSDVPNSLQSKRLNANVGIIGSARRAKKAGSNSSFSPNDSGIADINASLRTPSIMQQLQEERKQRLVRYNLQKALISNETLGVDGEAEWPGFGLTPVAETLWDEEFEPWKAKGSDFHPHVIAKLETTKPTSKTPLLVPPVTAEPWSKGVGDASISDFEGGWPGVNIADSIMGLSPAPLSPRLIDSSIVAWGPPSTCAATGTSNTEEWKPSPNDPDIAWTEELLREDSVTQ